MTQNHNNQEDVAPNEQHIPMEASDFDEFVEKLNQHPTTRAYLDFRQCHQGA